MGSTDDDSIAYSYEKPQHIVTLKPFAMSQTPITQAQWKVVAKELPKVNLDLDPNQSRFKGPDLPVDSVIWEQAMEFCNRMTQYTVYKITLPTESQWEYACRAGTTTRYSFGNTIDKTLANYDWNISQTTPVYTYPPNPWGLHDMHGNVYEWCLDDWHDDYNGAPTDGSAWYGGNDRKVIRGGAWHTDSHCCRSTHRHRSFKFHCDWNGFRVVINP